MKKLGSLLIMGITALGLIGCGNNPSSLEAAEAVGQPATGNTGGQGALPASPAPIAAAPAADFGTNSITVNSSEKVSVVPDIAEVVYCVRTNAREASACQQQNAESVGQVIELLKSLGIEETSIQTSDYNMNPVYDYSSNTARLTGYESITTLTVSDLPIDGIERLNESFG